MVSPSTKIGDLIEEHPFLVDFLPTLSPRYEALRSPTMRATMGKVATVEMAAKMGGLEVDELVTAIESEIARHVEGDASAPTEEELARRKEVLKGIIRDIHAGADIEELKVRFASLIKGVGPAEISAVEQALIADGMPAEEIKRLCDVHVEVFKSSLEMKKPPSTPPGHPVHTYMQENQASADIMRKIVDRLEGLEDALPEVKGLLDELAKIDIHYTRKENQLFPALERHGITGPSQVMWAIHDDIRALVKQVREALDGEDVASAATLLRDLVGTIGDMVYKEEHILYPAALEALTEEDWVRVRQGEEEIGYAWVTPAAPWPPEGTEVAVSSEGTSALSMDTGALTHEQLNLLLKHLPFDVTFVSENDEVLYYSDTPERIFPRSAGVIGRKVQNCHPPKSVHAVTRILDEFRAGTRDVAEFWIHLHGKFLYIRYFAVRDGKGTYRGCLEVMQEISRISKLEGDKRLLDDSTA